MLYIATTAAGRTGPRCAGVSSTAGPHIRCWLRSAQMSVCHCNCPDPGVLKEFSVCLFVLPPVSALLNTECSKHSQSFLEIVTMETDYLECSVKTCCWQGRCCAFNCSRNFSSSMHLIGRVCYWSPHSSVVWHQSR